MDNGITATLANLLSEPHNLSVEARLSGLTLYDNNAFQRVADFVSADDFLRQV